ncbi:MAG TPA: class I SAM-dependent methyltransferase, partial [Chthonomonadales bacterium]|nr:class I SAM-dependent methyltransferase [Chthonomonadales bacterium]
MAPAGSPLRHEENAILTEAVENCPACGAASAKPLHCALTDRSFRVVDGQWDLLGCAQCGAAYLNPRLNEATISNAYARYYTHEKRQEKLTLRRPQAMLRNDYLNSEFGYRISPWLPLGRFLLSGDRKAGAARSIRHLSFASTAPRRPRVLDVGCGAGAFLRLIETAGWQAFGIDPDSGALNLARAIGATVSEGTLSSYSHNEERFDAITLNHVIEHLHQPLEALRIARRLLKPGGTIWLATPNLESLGHKRFGSDWVGLDPPRHLILFSPSSLTGLLERAGFTEIGAPQRVWAAKWHYAASEAIRLGLDPYSESPL